MPVTARRAIEDDSNDKLISAASAWEIATKYRTGKLKEAETIVLDLPGVILGQGFEELDIIVDEAVRAGMLPGHHRDPFDRMLIAQALARNLVIITGDSLFDRYGVRRLW